MKKIIILFACILYLGIHSSFASEKHAHEEGTEEHSEEAGQGDHGDHEEEEGEDHAGHDEEKEEGHEEESSAVGPGKGITEKSKEGIKLSAKAWKVMEIQTGPISGKVMEINHRSLVEIKSEKAIYRVRGEWIKKVSVKVLKKNGDKILIEISSHQPGDLLVTSGVGFVRTAELVAEEGAASGHSH